jgi:hypothetical protein
MRVVTPDRAHRRRALGFPCSADDLFALMCPVRETEWARGWEPELVISGSGFAEQGCVFTTRRGSSRSVWVISEYDRRARSLRMIRVTNETEVCQIDIGVEPASKGATVAIAYTLTALGGNGAAVVAAFTEEHYAAFIAAWQSELANYLTRVTR